MHCPACGAPATLADQLFCLGCGKDLREARAAAARFSRPLDLTTVMGPTPREAPSFGKLLSDPSLLVWLLLGAIFSLVATMVGVVFSAIGAATDDPVFLAIGLGVLVVFGGVGAASLRHAVKKIRQVRRIWRHGEPQRGELVEASIDRSTRVNGRSPVRVTYRYRTFRGEFSGAASCWNYELVRAPAGSFLTLLVDQEDPSQSVWVEPSRGP